MMTPTFTDQKIIFQNKFDQSPKNILSISIIKASFLLYNLNSKESYTLWRRLIYIKTSLLPYSILCLKVALSVFQHFFFLYEHEY